MTCFKDAGARALRAAAVEFRRQGAEEWETLEILPAPCGEDWEEDLRLRCARLARAPWRGEDGKREPREFRWRPGFLLLESPDKCEIFKNEQIKNEQV